MKLGLINSAWAQAGPDTAFGIPTTMEIGFDSLDVFADPRVLGDRERRLIRPRSAPEELSRLRGLATHVHLSDCDGKVHGDLPPGRGVVDFVPYLRAIKALDIDGAVSIELEYSPEPDRIVEWVREAYEQTDRLLS